MQICRGSAKSAYPGDIGATGLLIAPTRITQMIGTFSGFKLLRMKVKYVY